MYMKRLLGFAAALAVITPLGAFAAFVSFEVGGDGTAASIAGTVNAFRAALGDPNNASDPGPLPTGRREINWDGGGAVVTSPAPPVFTGFQNTRGALFTTPGTGFLQVPLDLVDDEFSNPTYTDAFSFFSPVRLFTPVASNTTDVTFFVPGTSGATPATVTGFGAVFTDVDASNGAELQFYGISNQLLFSDFVEPGTVAEGSLSFLGAIGNAGERIARVRIISGTTAPGPDDDPPGVDIVLMDDFIYAEPQSAVPEPGTVLLLLGGVAGILGLARTAGRQ
jgi:hypothetical protein